MAVAPVSEGLLLTVAQIAATLIGLLLVGMFFYVETGFRRLTTLQEEAGATRPRGGYGRQPSSRWPCPG